CFPGLARDSTPYRALCARKNYAYRRVESPWKRSPREQTVLAWIARPLTMARIADELFVSLDTMKSHTRHIYRRLGVSNRYDDIERARSLNLLQSDMLSLQDGRSRATASRIRAISRSWAAMCSWISNAVWSTASASS